MVRRAHPGNHYCGLDFSEELLAVARARELSGCDLRLGDARTLPYEAGSFDVVYSERCLINILDWDGQRKALNEIGRVLRPGGYYLMIECFTDGLENNNRARRELEKLDKLSRHEQLDPVTLLWAHLGVGDKEEALADLEKAYSEHFGVLTTLKVEPAFDSLRSDPRFQDLLRRVGLAQ